MSKQNSLRRTLISCLIVIFLSALSWSIQNYMEEHNDPSEPFEASINLYEAEHSMH